MFGSWRLAEQDSGQSLLASGASTQGRKKQWRILSFASLDFFSPFSSGWLRRPCYAVRNRYGDLEGKIQEFKTFIAL